MKVNGFAVPGLACGVERKSHFSLAYSCSAQSKEDSLEKKMGGNCPDLEIFLCSDFFRKRLNLSHASLKGNSLATLAEILNKGRRGSRLAG